METVTIWELEYVKIVETDFDSDTQNAYIFINDEPWGSCDQLDEEWTFDWVTCVDINEEYLSEEYGFDYTDGGGYLEIGLSISDEVNFVSYDPGNGTYYDLYGEVMIDCMQSPNDTRSPTTIPTPSPTEVPTTIPTSIPTDPDYLWLLESPDEEFEYSVEFGCDYAGCNVSKRFVISCQCYDPWLSISMVETDYNNIDIYVNSVSLGQCEGLNGDCSHDWVACENAYLYPLHSFFYDKHCDDWNSSTIVRKLVTVTIENPNTVNVCPYNISTLS